MSRNDTDELRREIDSLRAQNARALERAGRAEGEASALRESMKMLVETMKAADLMRQNGELKSTVDRLNGELSALLVRATQQPAVVREQK